MSVQERPIYEWLEFINICMFNYQIGVYKAFVNEEESFREGPFYAQITPNLLLYLRMFHEWGPLLVKKKTSTEQKQLHLPLYLQSQIYKHVLHTTCYCVCTPSIAQNLAMWSTKN